MEPSNGAIADALEELGDLYELDGAIVHRVLAYRSGARAVREAPVSVSALAREGRAVELAGIGKTLQEKIVALADTGTIPATEKLRAKFPAGLVSITRLPGIGAKRARLLHSALGVDSPETLREAALGQRIRDVRGLGPKFEESVLTALDRARVEAQDGADGAVSSRARLLLPQALELGETLARGLADGRAGAGATVLVAGSARRMADSVKDIDLVAFTTKPAALAKSLAQLAEVESVTSASATGARGRLHVGVGIDLRVGRPEQAGNLLQHFTGSGLHNAALREFAVKQGFHVSEHGVLDDGEAGREAAARSVAGVERGAGSGAGAGSEAGSGAGRTLTFETEQEVYGLLGLDYIEPELREDRGELEAARLETASARTGPKRARSAHDQARSALPDLIERGDIKGDLHSHTVASDGKNTIEEMAKAARELGYGYLAITDHSASHGFGNDVSPEELRRQIERVREVDDRMDGIKVLAGSEVNILPDGSLDYSDELLAELDWVIASVHTAFGMGEQEMTGRVIRAIEHPLVDAIGHPTGRLIERREPYEIDLGAVFAAAARTGTLIEINANPDRRDLSDVHARHAAQAGVTLVIDSDAHRTATLQNMRWGIATARRAWLTKEDVANTRPWAELSMLRKRTARGARA
ncbi:MAG TPA: PHP domain-containing protein [Solirubrobacteraceae bacterium]|nr:PHP domain-containing protein [Solirubrobacteraceae bacterium]